MIQLKPCKHLDYNEDEYDAELRIYKDYPNVKYWYRTNIPFNDIPRNVQFCKKYGRINGIFQCYTGEMFCYETE